MTPFWTSHNRHLNPHRIRACLVSLFNRVFVASSWHMIGWSSEKEIKRDHVNVITPRLFCSTRDQFNFIKFAVPETMLILIRSSSSLFHVASSLLVLSLSLDAQGFRSPLGSQALSAGWRVRNGNPTEGRSDRWRSSILLGWSKVVQSVKAKSSCFSFVSDTVLAAANKHCFSIFLTSSVCMDAWFKPLTFKNLNSYCFNARDAGREMHVLQARH